MFQRQSAKSGKAAPLVTLAVVLVVAGCPISQEIKVKFPKDANWHFDYNDAVGEYLGFGKAEFSVDMNEGSFTMTITENAFGDKAVMRGWLIDSADTVGRIPFEARGKWFDGEDYRMEGAFNDRLTGTLNCAIACKESIYERIDGLRIDFEACRVQVSGGSDDMSSGSLDEALLNGLFFFKASRQSPVQPSLTGLLNAGSDMEKNE